MDTYFNIRYELDRKLVHRHIASQLERGEPSYICVADGVILNTANRNADYLRMVNGGMFSICDSGYVPLYLKWLYGIKVRQYCGSEIFRDIIEARKYRMFFMGTSHNTLQGLKKKLTEVNPDVADMTFYELPYRTVDEFDYPDIARRVEQDGANIIWVALGAPKQEIFMSRLKPHLKRGVMIAVGAAFKFYSGTDERRAPAWMVRHHMEFTYRILKDPKKQLKRCAWIIATLPRLLWQEWRRKKRMEKQDDKMRRK